MFQETEFSKRVDIYYGKWWEKYFNQRNPSILHAEIESECGLVKLFMDAITKIEIGV